MNDPPTPKKGKKLSMSMSIHALVRGFVDQLVSWFISLLVDPSIHIFLLPSVDPYMFICPSSCLSILFSAFHPSVYLSKKQGRIHGNPVADGWAGALMQQVTQGLNIVADGWAGASNPHPHHMPPHQHTCQKRQLKHSFFHYSTCALRMD